MGQLTLTISYQKNTGIVLSPSELAQLYFFGIPLVDKSGNPMDDDTILFYIEDAQKQLQDSLNIKLNKTYITESRDYIYDDWINWAYMPTTYPVITPKSLKGYINTSLQIDYPQAWLRAKSQSPDKDLYHRSITLVPATGGSSSVSASPVIFGISPYIGFFGNKTIPHYWEQCYTTGFDTIPADLLKAVGMAASITLFTILQDLSVGAGVASKSISTDGLNQSVSVNSKGVYNGRITQYQTMLDQLMLRLKSRYTGITFGVLG